MKVKLNLYVDEEIKAILREYAECTYLSISAIITKLVLENISKEGN